MGVTGSWGLEGPVVGGGRAPDPGRPGKRHPPPGTLMPPPQRAKPARKSARCGVGEGSPRPEPLHPQPVGSGPRPHASKTSGRGWESARLRAPDTHARGAPPGALVPPPQRAKPARKSARCGVVEGSPRPEPLHPQPVGSGPQPHAPKDGRSGVRERPTPDAPHPGKGRPQRAPSYRPHNALSQLARARTVGLVTGPHARTSPHPHPLGSGPRPHAPKDGRSGVGEHPTADAPHPGKRRPPRGALVPPQQRAKPARKSARCGVGDGSTRPHPSHQQPVGSGPRPHARKDDWSGLGERPILDAQARGAPRSPSCRPNSARSQLARARALGLVTGPHARSPPHPQPVGTGPRPHARKEEWSGVGERPTPDAPHPGKRRPPQAPSCRPQSAQSQLPRACAVGLVTGHHARTPRTHSQWVVAPGRITLINIYVFKSANIAVLGVFWHPPDYYLG